MLIYFPSKGSSFGHATLPRSLPKIVPHLFKFLREYTINSGPKHFSLDVYAASAFDSQDHTSECVRRVTDFMGSPPGPGDMFIGDLGQKSIPMNVKWPVPSQDFDKVVAFIVEGHPWPRQLLGPVTLCFSYEFLWRDPRTGRAFADQEATYPAEGSLTSELRVDLQQNSFIAADLKFPYDLSDARLYDMLSTIVPALPFKPSVKHFRKWIPLKDGTKHKLRRLESSELTRLSEFVT